MSDANERDRVKLAWVPSKKAIEAACAARWMWWENRAHYKDFNSEKEDHFEEDTARLLRAAYEVDAGRIAGLLRGAGD